jgi:GNAT superfamily N-acetyltransferase
VGASAADFEDLLALRLRAMRASLEQLGRYDEARARKRLAEGFAPEQTRHIVLRGQRVGFVMLKRLSHVLRLNHLYIDPPAQRHGLGHEVLSWVCEQADRAHLPLELCALKGSAANRFYLRHGFVMTGEGEWDIDYVRLPQSPGMRTVRALYAAMQARNWAAVRALLQPAVQTVWWASGERLHGADAFVEVNARYPEGWTIQLLEVSRLDDGRVLALVRVDHPPATFFSTSIFRVDDGLVAGIDETWATLEEPPPWRRDGAVAGCTRFDPRDDPRACVP